jgi:hypothetical protein
MASEEEQRWLAVIGRSLAYLALHRAEPGRLSFSNVYFTRTDRATAGTSQIPPHYQLYIYFLLLDKFFVAQDERTLEASFCDVRSQNHSSFS